MNRIIYNLCIGCFLFIRITFLQAQSKNICISEELSDHVDMLKIKLATKKFKFGDYQIVESKEGWNSTKVKSNFLGTKAETETNYDFAFRLTNKLADTAIVKANKNVSVKEIRSFELFDGFFIGDDEVLNQSDFFRASITLSNHKDDTWALVMGKSYHKDLVDREEIAFLQKAQRNITIAEVSSRECSGDKQRFPAMGFEFFENDQAIGALQYRGRGVFGTNNYGVWLKPDMDENSKLILAASMTALMKIKLSSFESYNEE